VARRFTPLATPYPSVGPYQAVAQLVPTGAVDLLVAHKQSTAGFVRRALVKRVRRGVPDYAEGRQRLFEEAQALAFVEHPGVPALLDFAEDTEGTYLARELVDGSDLAQLTATLRARGEALPFELAAFVACEVARALHHAHTAETPDGRALALTHQGVCPAHVLISRAGHVRLIGFARSAARIGSLDPTSSATGRADLGFVAPEVLAGVSSSAASDVYGTGVLLFELLTGRPCFKAKLVGDLLAKITKNELRLERLDDEGVPRELRRIVERACQLGPEYRFVSAADLANALDTWLIQANLHASAWMLAAFATQHGLIERAERWTREPVLVLSPARRGVATLPPPPATPTPPPPEPPPSDPTSTRGPASAGPSGDPYGRPEPAAAPWRQAGQEQQHTDPVAIRPAHSAEEPATARSLASPARPATPPRGGDASRGVPVDAPSAGEPRARSSVLPPPALAPDAPTRDVRRSNPPLDERSTGEVPPGVPTADVPVAMRGIVPTADMPGPPPGTAPTADVPVAMRGVVPTADVPGPPRGPVSGAPRPEAPRDLQGTLRGSTPSELTRDEALRRDDTPLLRGPPLTSIPRNIDVLPRGPLPSMSPLPVPSLAPPSMPAPAGEAVRPSALPPPPVLLANAGRPTAPARPSAMAVSDSDALVAAPGEPKRTSSLPPPPPPIVPPGLGRTSAPARPSVVAVSESAALAPATMASRNGDGGSGLSSTLAAAQAVAGPGGQPSAAQTASLRAAAQAPELGPSSARTTMPARPSALTAADPPTLPSGSRSAQPPRAPEFTLSEAEALSPRNRTQPAIQVPSPSVDPAEAPPTRPSAPPDAARPAPKPNRPARVGGVLVGTGRGMAEAPPPARATAELASEPAPRHEFDVAATLPSTGSALVAPELDNFGAGDEPAEARTLPSVESPLRRKAEAPRVAAPRPNTEPEGPSSHSPVPPAGLSNKPSIPPWSGDLATTRGPDVVSRLVNLRATGTLELKAGSVWKKLALRDGRPQVLSSNVGLEGIGEQLVRGKLLTRFDLDKALRESPRGEDGLIERLLATQTLTAAQLAPELGRNITEGLSDAFGWRQGTFEFTPGPAEAGVVDPGLDLAEWIQQRETKTGLRSSGPESSPSRTPPAKKR
jgi:serine/threonine-protein kinase